MSHHPDHAAPVRGHHAAAMPSMYGRLLAMAAISYAAMYLLMYAMVDAASSIYLNVNQAYMAGLMAAPMVIIELILMRRMYANRQLNYALVLAAIVVTGLCWLMIRAQTGVEDRQFLRSMIPHHSGAILMCGKANLHDARIKSLCEGIIAGQKQEIEQMKMLLAEPAR